MFKILIEMTDKTMIGDTAPWFVFDEESKLFKYENSDEEIQEEWLDSDKLKRIKVDGSIVWSKL